MRKKGRKRGKAKTEEKRGKLRKKRKKRKKEEKRGKKRKKRKKEEKGRNDSLLFLKTIQGGQQQQERCLDW